MNPLAENPVYVDTVDELLDYYLSLPRKQREEQFICTSTAAEMTGLGQRTIQLWIEVGKIRTLRFGNRHKILRESLIEYLKLKAHDSA
jgi:excisionase family DNA binding protein